MLFKKKQFFKNRVKWRAYSAPMLRQIPCQLQVRSAAQEHIHTRLCKVYKFLLQIMQENHIDIFNDKWYIAIIYYEK